ncbi:MAG: HD domain-containing phosphohydrolase [Oscillospiraceae bacterium]
MVYNLFFWGVPVITLATYLILIFFFAISKKDRAIRAFQPILFALALWSASSLLMKLQLPPGPLFWNKMMMVGVITSPLLIYIFLSVFTDTVRIFRMAAFSLVTIAFIVIDITLGIVNYANVIEKTVIEGGKTINQIEFSYELSMWAVPTYIAMLFFTVIITKKIHYCLKTNKSEYKAVRPILIGIILVFCGLLSNIIPQLGKYPIDILTSFINGLLIFYAIYRNRMLEMKFMLTQGLVYSIFSCIIMGVYIFVAYHLNRLLAGVYLANEYIVFILALLVAMLFQPVLSLTKKLSELIFYKSEYSQRNALKSFNINISNTLSLTEISDKFIETINNAMNPRHTCLLLEDDETGVYTTFNSLQKLNPMALTLDGDHPVVAWLREKNQCITREELDHSILFKSMWDAELTALRNMDTEVLVPLRCRDDLIGIILLTSRRNNISYTSDDLDLLKSFSASTAMAISNAALYAKAKNEAYTDDMTGIYNRRYLFKYLKEQLFERRADTVSIIIFDLDRFKLYNELYGYTEGDNAIAKVAALIAKFVDRRGISVRYSGEQFAAVLPGVDASNARILAEKVRVKVQQTFFDDESTTKQFLTISSGICSYPVCAGTSDELLHRANLALLKAKEAGKNTTVVYASAKSTALNAEEDRNNDTSDLRATIYALTAAIDAKDHYTFAHSQNVAKYATAIARELGLDSVTQKIIYEAGLLHDVGKIGIPEHILTKAERLTDEEYTIIRKHVDISINIVKHLPSMAHVIPAIVAHHERWDGKGYPRGISGERIPIEARCLAVADTFDAITSIRPYKTPLSTEYALREIERNIGTQFDPKVASAFLRMVRAGRVDVTPATSL